LRFIISGYLARMFNLLRKYLYRRRNKWRCPLCIIELDLAPATILNFLSAWTRCLSKRNSALGFGRITLLDTRDQPPVSGKLKNQLKRPSCKQVRFWPPGKKILAGYFYPPPHLGDIIKPDYTGGIGQLPPPYGVFFLFFFISRMFSNARSPPVGNVLIECAQTRKVGKVPTCYSTCFLSDSKAANWACRVLISLVHSWSSVCAVCKSALRSLFLRTSCLFSSSRAWIVAKQSVICGNKRLSHVRLSILKTIFLIIHNWRSF